MNNLQFDFSDLKRVWEEIENKYIERYSGADNQYEWKTIYNADDLMIDISKDEQHIRISRFHDFHFKDERILHMEDLFREDGEGHGF